LSEAFSKAKSLVRPKVRLVFKGVTYELLTNDRFLEVAKKAFPGVDVFHEEFDASRGRELERPLWNGRSDERRR
jgi:hypothetical protein